jgi:hypothetical protein
MTYSHFWFRHLALDIKALSSLLTEFKELRQISEEWGPWRPRLATYGEWLATDHAIGESLLEAGRIMSVISKATQTDALYYSGHSVTDTFVYCHWKAGKLLRAFEYKCGVEDSERQAYSWGAVEGEPEPWEREVFFTEKRLRAVLSEDHGASTEEKAAFEVYWRTGRIAKGQSEPAPTGARDIFWEIVKRNELPTCYHAH